MPTNRCSLCAYNWPQSNTYRRCPQCQEKTSPIANVAAMPDDEARSLKAHLDFERFYEAWDATRPADRLVPDLSTPSAEVS